MKTLIVEDDLTSSLLIKRLLERYGPLHVAEDGAESVEAERFELDAGQPFDLICLDIMMPRMYGQTALAKIREMEEAMGIGPNDGAKVIMTTDLADSENVIRAGRQLCASHIVKPIAKAKLVQELRKLGLIPLEDSEEAV